MLRCDGTFTQVRRGDVDVVDSRLNRLFRVPQGRTRLSRQDFAAAPARRPAYDRDRATTSESARAPAGAVLRHAARQGRRGGRRRRPAVVDLGRGNPEVGPPPHVVEALRAAAARPDVHGYAPIRGLPRLREAIAERYRAVYGAAVDPDSEVAIVPGTKTAIVELSTSLAARGDTILLPDPYYPDYPSGAALAGAHIGLLPLDPAAGWRPDLDSAPPAAAAFLNYPSNPCAVCAPPGLFEEAVAYGDRTGTAIVHDAAYIDLVFDGRAPQSFLATPGARDVGVELWTMSKTYGMAGWRIGFVLGNAELVERVNLMNDHLRVGIFAPLQEAAIAALTGPRTPSRSDGQPTSGAATGSSPSFPSRRCARAPSTSGCGFPTA